jgi:DNA-binding beta-propeller fold protein YncE
VEAGGESWVTDELAGRISILGGSGGGKSLPAGLQPGGLDTAGGRVAVADVRGNALYVFDVKSQRQVAVLAAGAGPTHVVHVGPTTVAVADTRGDAILLYDLSGHPRLLDRLPMAGGPYGLAADPGHHRLWVALSGRNQLVAIDIAGTRLRATSVRLATVQQPNSVAVSAATGELVVVGATPRGAVEFIDAGSG